MEGHCHLFKQMAKAGRPLTQHLPPPSVMHAAISSTNFASLYLIFWSLDSLEEVKEVVVFP